VPFSDRLRVTGVKKGVAIGIVAGFLSGLFGVGGGILIVPALVMFARSPQRLAHGTSLASVLPIAASGLIGFALHGSVDWVAAVLLVLGSVVGAVIGTRLLRTLPVRALALAFSALLVVTAARMFLETGEGLGRPDLDAGLAAGLVGLGLASGILAGLLGVGGGVVMVPGMVLLFGLPAALAKGTSLAVIIPTALAATQRNLRHGNADVPMALAIGVSGVATAMVGSQISVGLSDAVATALFAVLLVALAARMLWSLRFAEDH
jgi:uncharacterized membrane protein YfcA